MINLREKIERDLKKTLEGKFGLTVVLLSPDGEKQTHSANDPELLLKGQVIFDIVQENPNTGSEVIVHKPVATLRQSSLERVPQPKERWAMEIPTTPIDAGSRAWFLAERPREDGGGIGFIRLYGIKMIQEPP